MDLRQKLISVKDIVLFAVRSYPIRIYRLLKHILPFWYRLGNVSSFFWLLEWPISFVLLVGDLLFLPELICIVFILLKKDLRRLSPKEDAIKTSLFQGSLVMPIFLNNSATLLTRKGRIAFVSFYIIHSCGMSDRTYAHELIHNYQFSRYGSPYIIRCLIAQASKEGYDYGGPSRLMDIFINQQKESVLNYEQKGEVLADYFMLRNNEKQFSESRYFQLTTSYEHIIKQWRSKDIYRW